jgi:HK97 family phage portal protein
MALLDNLKNMLFTPPVQTKAEGSTVSYFNVGNGKGKTLSYEDLASEGYLKNAIVYRCVNEISKGAASVGFRVKSGDDILENHPLLSLLHRPNPLQSGSEFFSSLYGYLLLSGNSYMLGINGLSGTPRELHLLRPDRIAVKGTVGGVFPDRYEYSINGTIQSVYDVDQATGYSDLKQVKLWHPLDDFYGCSPLTAAAMEVDQHNSATRHNINLLENGARPSGAVIFKPQDDQGYKMQLSESQRQQLLTDLNQRFAGSKNAGRPMLLEGDFDWKEMGLSPRDMDFLNMKHMAATDIALCFGVPSQLVGVPDGQTYSNVAEARLALYEETIIPYLKKVESDINEWLVLQYDQDIYFEYDVDAIPALSERRRIIYQNVIGAVDKGIMTRNEARKMVGLSPINGADDLLVPANLFALNDGPVAEAADPVEQEDVDLYDDRESEAKEITDFPTAGENLKVSLKNSQYPQFSFQFAEALYDDKSTVGREIWGAGGNIRGNGAFQNWMKAREGSTTPAILDWIKEREAWCARHTVVDGNQFVGGKTKPTLSNIAGVVALIKWGAVNPKLGQQGMKDVVLEVVKKLEGRQDPDEKAVSARVKEGLTEKVKEHNDKVGDNPTKRATLGMLTAVFERGVGAYRTNPQSVRPSVTGPDQWAYARVNSFLFALANDRFQGGAFDTDLFPKGHPLSSKK